MKHGIIATFTLALVSLSAQAEDQACATVRLADPGWSDIAATNALTGAILGALGYTGKVETLAVPIIYGGMRNGQVDAFLGNWMPAQQAHYDQFVKTGQVTELAQNLVGTEFTLAVPTYVWEGGVKSFDDLAKHADQFGKKIYGIGAGAPANQSLQKIIQDNEFGLGGWQLVESSEQAMLSQVVGGLSRLDPAPHERRLPHQVPDRRRQVLRDRGYGEHPDAQGLRRAVPQSGPPAEQHEIHPGHGKRRHERRAGQGR